MLNTGGQISDFRGACNAILLEKYKARGEKDFPGVVTHSSGNHGQAVAWAASQGNICILIMNPCLPLCYSNKI